MVDVRFEQGVLLARPGLWLDPWRPQPRAFVSHAHSDHTGRHPWVLCTPATARLMQERMGGDPPEVLALDYGQRRDFDGWSATLLPAGHVLGSAQLFFESGEGTLLYTGDFKLREGFSAERAEACEAETLIMETTYGLPHYRFPPSGETLAEILKFCVETLEEGGVPILLGYALGKAQEILAALAGAGFSIMVHPSIGKFVKIYQEFGVTFPPFEELDAARAEGHVLICPPGANGSRLLNQIPHRRVAALTGWAMDPGAWRRLQVHAAFPLSDHADYNDLLRHVEAVKPKRVLTLHGFAAEFAGDLRAHGIEAWALTGPNQMEFTGFFAPAAVRRTEVPTPLKASGFNRFCLVCEQIRQTAGKLEKIRILGEYLRSLEDKDLARASLWLTGRPFAQSDDQPVNIGGALIRRALMSASGLTEAEIRVISRRNNDAGVTAAEVMEARPGTRAVPLSEMAELFTRLRVVRGPLVKAALLAEMLAALPSLAGGYLVRILTGDLRIGLKEGLLEEAVAAVFEAEPAAVREANMLLGDMGRAAVLARKRNLASATLTLFRPVKCMLATPEPSEQAIWERLGGEHSIWIEDKLDGIRAQVHCSAGRAEIYSRDLKSITETFPEIAAAAARAGRAAVFDGEILARDKGRALSFFELQKRLGRRGGDLFLGGEIPVAYVIFDLLFVDGKSLLRLPLRERRQWLEKWKLPPPLQLAPVDEAARVEDLEAAFLAARDRGNEGLMAKDPLSSYTPGRRGFAWIKLKKEMATLDVVVVAAEYGHGRRNKVLSDYTFAIRDEHGAFLPIGKAYSGLTDREIEELTAEFLSLAVSRRGNRLEVEPRVVLEVAFDSIQPSDRHASGLALRFPRIKRVRRDKLPGEIDTLDFARRLADREIKDRVP